MPCDVANVVVNNCHKCHGAEPIGGAIRLVTPDDWQKQSPLFDPTKKVYEVARVRLADGTMPQGSVLAAEDLATLDGWLAAGAQASTDPADASCGSAAGDGVIAGGGADTTPASVGPGGTIDVCSKPGAYDPLVAEPGETCYEFPVHAPNSDGPFTVPNGESYHEWYYAVPWGPNDVWTRYGADFDNLPVLHHYLIFTSQAGRSPGDVAQNVAGTTLGTSATLIGGWAVGGCSTRMPDDVGGQLPPAPLIMIQWHLYNTTGAPALDNSKVQMCTVPADQRENIAGITFLGTENFNSVFGMPAGENHFTTKCQNTTSAPITVIGFTPHMHLIGTNMKTDLKRADGTVTTIFDQPFQFDYQVGYEIPPAVVNPGDTLETTCSFFNDTGRNVAFGESTETEMCYQFALSYPAGALDNGALSLIGALNTCW